MISPLQWRGKGKYNAWNGQALCQGGQEVGERERRERHEVSVCQDAAFSVQECLCMKETDRVWAVSKSLAKTGRQTVHSVVNDSSLVWWDSKCTYMYILYIADADACVYEVDRVGIYSGLSGPALETVALLWIFKEPIYYWTACRGSMAAYPFFCLGVSVPHCMSVFSDKKLFSSTLFVCTYELIDASITKES